MKLVTFTTENNQKKRLGIIIKSETVIDIPIAAKLLGIQELTTIHTMKDFLYLGNKGLNLTQELAKKVNNLSKGESLFGEIQSKALFSFSNIALTAPITDPGKIICLGRNYAEHAKEGGKEPPKNPMIWGKFNSAIIGPNETIVLPPITKKVDVEVELVVVIGMEGKNIPEEKALEYVAGYMIGNDVSARDFQYADKQYTRSKTMDTFAPIGPWIVTKDEIPNPQKLTLKCLVNNRLWQEANTKQMIFPVAYIISYLSKSFTFHPGDIIFTGTPSGVGHYQDPPCYLKDGDKVILTIDKIGTLENPVVQK